MSSYERSTRNLIAKIIEELHFEDVLQVQNTGDLHQLQLSNSCYHFEARVSVWKQLWINAESITKNENEPLSALDFILEINEILLMDDQTLAQFIEEANQTLYADMKLAEFKNLFSIDSLLDISFSRREQLLDGHPKLLLNKGRIGWGVSQLESFSPEYGGQFKLVWLAVKDELLIQGSDSNFDYTNFLSQHSMAEYGDGFTIVPAHPWQWDRYIRIQFLESIEAGDIVYLGEKGKYYTPQASIRTLSSGSDYDVKLSLSILNTSCVRAFRKVY
jgi:Siderophore synthetase component